MWRRGRTTAERPAVCAVITRARDSDEQLHERVGVAGDVFVDETGGFRDTPLPEEELATYRATIETIRAETLTPLVAAYDEWIALASAPDQPDVQLQRDFAVSYLEVAAGLTAGDQVVNSIDLLDPRFAKAADGIRCVVTNAPSATGRLRRRGPCRRLRAPGGSPTTRAPRRRRCCRP